jgi:hypothetical protein
MSLNEAAGVTSRRSVKQSEKFGINMQKQQCFKDGPVDRMRSVPGRGPEQGARDAREASL